MSAPVDHTDPANCPLHFARVKGNALCYLPRSDGVYSSYAPSCSGCTYGATERALFARRNAVGTAWSIATSSNTAENVKVALQVIADSLINADDADANDARYRLKQLLGNGSLAVPPNNDGTLPPLASQLLAVALETATDENRHAARAFIGSAVLNGGLECLKEASALLDMLYNR